MMGDTLIYIVINTPMGLFRLLLILGIIYLAYRLYDSWQRLSRQPKPEKPKQVKNVVPCHVCQLHIPETEAIQKNGRYYCSVQHLQQDQDS